SQPHHEGPEPPPPQTQKSPGNDSKAFLTNQNIVRRRPTLPHPPECSTIGAEKLNFRVRNVTGCFLPAITAATLRNTQPRTQPSLLSQNCLADASKTLHNTGLL